MTKPALTAVYSPHDDGLRSLVACHLAFSGEGEGLLVDLGGPYAPAGGLLDVTPSKSWADLMPVAHALSPDLLDRALTPCPPHGQLLAAPDADGAPALGADHLHNVVAQAQQRFRRIVLDLAASRTETAQAALRLAETVYLLVRADLAGLQQGRQAMAFLDRVGCRGQTRLLLAATALPKAVTAPEAETLLGPVTAVLPWDPAALTEALNLGTPLALRAGPLQVAMHQLASGHGPSTAASSAGWSRAKGLVRQVIKSATSPRPIPGTSR